jgi:uncharacterized protein
LRRAATGPDPEAEGLLRGPVRRGRPRDHNRYPRPIETPHQEWTVTRDDVRIAVRRWRPESDRGSAVVVVHGFAASKDARSVGGVSTALQAQGHLVVSYTARGHGESEGQCTLGDDERHDVAAAVALARRESDRVVVVGASMGAIAVLRHAAEVAPDGVVTVSSPAEWNLPRTVQSAGAAMLTQTPPGRWLARRALGVRLADEWTAATPPIELVRTIDAPLAVVHGRKDRFIKPAEAMKLHGAAVGPRRLELVAGMGHAYVSASIPAIGQAVDWTLSARRPADT